MKIKFSLFALLLILPSCGRDGMLEVRPIYDRLHGSDLPDDFSADSKQGWRDGCNTGYAAYGTNSYKFNLAVGAYDYTRDVTKIGNRDYETEWYNGYAYCRSTINTLVSDGVL